MSGGGSSGGQNTTTQVQQIPQYEQDFSRSNQDLAQSLSSQPYPQYGGQLIAPQNYTQQLAQGSAEAANYDWQPQVGLAGQTTNNALNSTNFYNVLGAATGAAQNGQDARSMATGYNASYNETARALDATGFNNYQDLTRGQTAQSLDPTAFNGYQQQARQGIAQGMDGSTVGAAQGMQAGATQQAQNLTNPNAVRGYMNPYIEQALAPQVQDLNLQLAQQQQGINSMATQSGAYGDARQGAMAALQNLYGNQAMNQLIGTGYNNAYTQAQQAVGQAENTQLGAATQYGNIAQSGIGEQGMQLQGSQQLQGLAGQQQAEQQLGLQGASIYSGLAQQQLGEQSIRMQGAQNYATLSGLGIQEQNTQLGAANAFAQQAGLVNNQQQIQLAGGAQQAALANQIQQQQLTGANAVYNVGQQQQTQQQNELNSAYQQYLNQVNWPYQMLNVRESALSNSPYNIQTAVTLPQANQAAQGFGTVASAAGLLGALGGSQNINNSRVFGGQ